MQLPMFYLKVQPIYISYCYHFAFSVSIYLRIQYPLANIFSNNFIWFVQSVNLNVFSLWLLVSQLIFFSQISSYFLTISISLLFSSQMAVVLASSTLSGMVYWKSLKYFTTAYTQRKKQKTALFAFLAQMMFHLGWFKHFSYTNCTLAFVSFYLLYSVSILVIFLESLERMYLLPVSKQFY